MIGSATNSVSNFSLSYNASTTSYTYTVNGTITPAALGKSVSFETLTDFSGSASSIHPTSGALKISDGTSAIITVNLSGEEITIAADLNGNGTTDYMTTTTWSELKG
jgi:hypothetical protein